MITKEDLKNEIEQLDDSYLDLASSPHEVYGIRDNVTFQI